MCHNGDKIECSFDKILETPIGEISVQNISKLNELIKSTLETDMAYAFLSHCKLYTTKHTGRACQKEQHFGIRFQSANEEDHFLLYLLRLADNFDSTHLRLLPNQKTALDKLLPFAKIYMETHFKHPEQFHVGSWPWHHIFEKSSAYGVNYTEEELISLKRIISYNPDFKPFLINENNINNQFKYFIGLWLIDDIQLNNSIKEVYLNVVIDTRQMTDVIWFYANQTSLSDASHNAPEIIVCSEFYAQRICPTEFHYQVEVKK
ncbi:MAG: hypothetical protein VW397_06755 [Candidatus Margulisiibacteriota bacterium]